MNDVRTEMLAAGLLISSGVDGVIGGGPVFERVVARLGRTLGRWGVENNAEIVNFPPVMSRAHLERNGYLKSFPQLAAALHGFRCDAHDHVVEPYEEDLPTGLMMVPVACYPVYPMVAARGKLPADGALFNLESWCFRREPSGEATRMQSFRVHEYVRLGHEAQVLEFRAGWIERGQALLAGLGLPATLDIASDPFFGRTGRLIASSQRERSLKFELLVPVMANGPPTALCSFNYAEDRFTEIWGIGMADGSKAYCGCVGFGLERLALALFRHHGLDPAAWPATVRAALGDE